MKLDFVHSSRFEQSIDRRNVVICGNRQMVAPAVVVMMPPMVFVMNRDNDRTAANGDRRPLRAFRERDRRRSWSKANFPETGQTQSD